MEFSQKAKEVICVIEKLLYLPFEYLNFEAREEEDITEDLYELLNDDDEKLKEVFEIPEFVSICDDTECVPDEVDWVIYLRDNKFNGYLCNVTFFTDTNYVHFVKLFYGKSIGELIDKVNRYVEEDYEY